MSARELVLEGDSVNVEIVIGVASTEYSITGPLAGVLRAAEAMFNKYPGLGYGTHVKYMTQLSDGSYGAQMGRSNSCD